MSDQALIALVGGGLFLSSLVATGARSLREFSRHGLQEICRRRKSTERFGKILMRHSSVARAIENFAVLIDTFVVVAGSMALARYLAVAANPNWQGIATVTLALGLALSAAKLWIPWAVVELWAEPFLYATWNIWSGIARLLGPLVWCGKLIDEILHRVAGREREIPTEESLEEEIRSIVSEGHRGGLLEEEAREMIEGVIELSDVDVSEIMTPRTDMVMIRLSMPWDEMLQSVIESGHTRIPFFEKNRDDVIGILHSKDLLPELASRNGEPIGPILEMLRKPYFVPETKAVDDLLHEFQRTGNHIAVVLDEYGGVSGLVTIEDVLEEIVGEIVDEHDESIEEEIKLLGHGACEALGKTHVDEINDRMALELPDDGDFDTIGGFVFSELGRIPATGESLDWQDQVRITVLEVTRRRIERVRVEVLDRQEQETT